MIAEAKRSKHSRHFDRRDIFPVSEVFEAMTQKGFFNGMGLHSKRYQVFFHSGPVCVQCGIEAQYFAQERHRCNEKYHMNLYAVRNGHEVLMTRDHIVPRSKGGSDLLDNQQTMCTYCNHRKGNKL